MLGSFGWAAIAGVGARDAATATDAAELELKDAGRELLAGAVAEHADARSSSALEASS